MLISEQVPFYVSSHKQDKNSITEKISLKLENF